MPPRRRRTAILASLVIVGVFAGIAGVRRVTTTSARPEVAPTEVVGEADRAPTTPPGMTAVPAPPEPARTVKAAPKLTTLAADDYRRRARFPPSSHPLAPDEEDPIARDRQLSPVSSRGRHGAEPTLTVFPSKGHFEAPESVPIYAMLTVDERRVAARDVQATVATEDLATVASLVFVDDGSGADTEAGDGVYSAFIGAEALDREQISTSYLVKVRAITLRDEERLAATSFAWTNPHARLTGRFSDALAEGGLAVDAEVDVLQAGRFHLEATLYDRTATEPIAWAQSAAVLDEGLGWIRLAFHGLALRERGLDGPYLLRFAALSTTTAMPNGKNNVVENAYVTAAHRVTAFSDTPYDDPNLLETADRLERDGMVGELDAGG